MGRPPKGSSAGVIVAVRVPPDLKRALVQMVADEKTKLRAIGSTVTVTESDVVRALIEKAAVGIKVKPAKVEASCLAMPSACASRKSK